MSERTFSVVLSARVDAYVSAMERAKQAGSGFSAQTSKNMAKVGQQMQQVGTAATSRVTLPIVALGGAAGKLAYDFETAFARMQGLANVPAGEIENLKESVLDLAGQTAVAPQELAEALYFAASAGLDSAQAMDAVTVAAQASAAGMGTTTDVVGLVASAIASYGADALDAAKATDILTRTVQEGRADPEELAGSLGRILPVAAQLGVEFEEVGGATAYLSNVFGDTGRTVTAMSGFLAKLVAPTAQGRKALTEMGTSADELQKVLGEQGLVAALELLRSKGFADNQQALRALFDDIEGYQGALALLNDSNGTLVSTMGAVADSTGALGGAYDAVANTDAFALKQALTDMKVALIEVGSVLLPLAADIVGPLAGGITELVEAVVALPTPLRNIVLGLAGAAAAAGPMLVVGGSLVKNFEAIKGGSELARMGLQRLGLSAGAASGTLGVLTGVAVAAGIAFAVYQSFGAEQRAVAARSSDVASGLDAATDAAIRNASATSGAAAAHQALSDALTSGEDGEKLVTALGTLGQTSSDALSVFIGLSEDTRAELTRLAASAGLTGEAITGPGGLIFFAENMSDDWVLTDRIGELATKMGVSEEQALVYARALIAVRQAAEGVDLDASIREYVTREAATSDLTQSLLAQAEAETGLSRTGSNLQPLYEAFVALMMENAGALGLSADATERNASALDNQASATDTASIAAADLLDIVKNQSTAFDRAKSSADGFNDALDAVFGAPRSIEEAQQAWAAGVDDLTESFKDNGRTLDINTEKGRANRDAIKDQVDNLGDYMVAMVRSGESAETAAAGGDMLRESLIGQLDELGLTREEAEAYLATLGLTPESIRTAVQLAKDQEAKERVEELLGKMEDLPLEVSTEIQALIETGQFDEAERRLLRLQSLAGQGASMPVRVAGQGGWGGATLADGRVTDGPLMALIGEAGTEVVLPLTRPSRMRALLSDPRVLPQVLNALGITAFANGGVVGSVVNSGSSGSTSKEMGRVMAAKFEVGDISSTDYRGYLSEQLGGLEKYSDDWMDVWRKIRTIDEQAAQSSRDRLAEEDAIQAAMLETGAVSADAYEVYLLRRLGSFEQYSADWMAVWRQLQDLQREEEQSSADRVRLAFDRAGAAKDLADAEQNLADAIAAANEADGKAYLYSVDKNRSTEEKAQAADELRRARERVADAAFTGAQARATNNGLTKGTAEWAQFVRREVEAYASTQRPEIAAALQGLLVGIPNFANGGYVNASPGGSLLRAGEAGQREWILQNSQLQAIRDNAGYQGAMQAALMSAGGKAAGAGLTVNGGIHVGSRNDLSAVDSRLEALAWRARRRS
jgi:TP901 family phage tail tape measure protein